MHGQFRLGSAFLAGDFQESQGIVATAFGMQSDIQADAA
jgi:hypothetical protein